MGNEPCRPQRIISGGQAGADIGGLVGAKRAGILTGGTAPKGYRTEKGPQVEALKSLGLVEHTSPNYRDRTSQNVRDSDATLIVATNRFSGGTRLTIQFCEANSKPYLVVDPRSALALEHLLSFIARVKPRILNVAGNRESISPGIAALTAKLVENAFRYEK